MIAEFGKTRSGYVNEEEWGAKAWRGFAGMFDKDHDGKVTLDELTQHMMPTRDDRGRRIEYAWWVKSFNKQDHDHKGYIDQRDVTLDSASDFHAHDLNHDGWLTPCECALVLPRRP